MSENGNDSEHDAPPGDSADDRDSGQDQSGAPPTPGEAESQDGPPPTPGDVQSDDEGTPQPSSGATAGGEGGVETPRDTGPSIVDKLQRPGVMDQLQVGLAAFGVVGVGLGFGGLLMAAISASGQIIAETIAGGTLLIGIPLAVIVAFRIDDILEEDPATKAAAIAIVAYAGYLGLTIVASVLTLLGAGFTDIGMVDAILPAILGGLGAVIAGVAVPFLTDALVGP